MNQRVLPLASAALGLVLAGQGHALSCLSPDPAATFQRAAASVDVYVVLRGSLAFDEKQMPKFDGANDPGEPAAVPARFSGMALGPDGFVIPYQTDLWLQPTCAGPWCGVLSPSDDLVAFARDTGAGVYVIELGPCGGNVFEPDPATVRTITTCMAGGACAPAE